MIKKLMVQRKIPFKEARIQAEKEIEGSVPQVGRSFASAAAAANGRQNSNPPPTKKTQQRQSQSGPELPGAIRAEALAEAIDLRETLRSAKKNSSNAVPTAPGSNGAQQTPKSKKKNRGHKNKSQAKPGNTTASAPQAAVDKQATKPAKQPAAKAGQNRATAPTPQVAVAKQAPKPDQQPAPKAGQQKDPASAPQAAGSKQTPSVEQVPEPVPSTSKAKPGDEPALDLQAAGMEQASLTPLPSSDIESEMEVTESAPQATVSQGSRPVTAESNNKGDSSGSPATSPNSLKEGHSFAAAAKESAQKSKEINKAKEGYNFEVQLAKQRAKRKPWSRKPRPKSDEPPLLTQNRFSPLDGYGEMDPEEIDPDASFPSDWCQ